MVQNDRKGLFFGQIQGVPKKLFAVLQTFLLTIKLIKTSKNRDITIKNTHFIVKKTSNPKILRATS